MKKYDSEHVRTIVLAGQRGVGKTTLGEAMLYSAGATTRFGSVDEETSVLDFEPEEHKRHSTVATAVAHLEWNDHKVNVLDTPGAGDFLFDTRLTINVSDLACILVGATDGVQVGTEKVWNYAGEAGVPRLVVVTGMDKERANFQEVLSDIQETLDRTAVPVMLPIGKEQDFKGVVNILHKKAYLFEDGKMTETDIPADMADAVEEAYESIVEVVAESDEELTDKYLEEGELSPEEVSLAFPKAVKEGVLSPILVVSAKRLVGIHNLLDFIVEFGPNPTERVFKAMEGDNMIEVKGSDGFASCIVFKTFTADVGRMNIFRIVSGKLDGDGNLLNVTKDTKERYSQLYTLMGKKRENAQMLVAGDIGAVAKLKNTGTGDTLTDGKNIKFVLPEPPEPVAVVAIHPKSKADEDKLGAKLADVVADDSALKTWRDMYFNELLLGGMGQMHLDVAIEKLKRMGVEVETSLPKIPYRETITKKSPLTEGKHKKQSGGRGQYGVCFIEIEPIPVSEGKDFEFVDQIFGGAIPKQYIPSVEKGIRDRMKKGILAGYPVINVRVYLKDGKYHPVDSSDAAFQIAGSKGFQAASKLAGPVLLEPIYKLEVTVPQDYMGTIMGDITSKRGRPMGSEQKGKMVIIEAEVPLAEVQRYAADLESMTSGRGTFTMSFSHYERVPPDIQEKIVAQAQLEEDED